MARITKIEREMVRALSKLSKPRADKHRALYLAVVEKALAWWRDDQRLTLICGGRVFSYREAVAFQKKFVEPLRRACAKLEAFETGRKAPR